MVSANREMAVYCFDTLVSHYTGENPAPAAFDDGEYALFVTWKKSMNGRDPRLRGCIGSLQGRPLISGFREYALTSALSDSRFDPIKARELPFLQCTVSVLTDFEDGLQYLDWEIEKHGIIIDFTDPANNRRLNATYLPGVVAEAGWTKIEGINSLIRKSGYNGPIKDLLRNRINLTRYQSTTFTLSYDEYAAYVETTRGAPPAL